MAYGWIRPAYWLAMISALFNVLPAYGQDKALPSTPAYTVDFPDTVAGRLAAAHMNAFVGVGEKAESVYQDSLRQLRAQPQAAQVLYESYQKTDETRYFRRWALVETLRELHSTAALTALSQIATSPIPGEKSRDGEDTSRGKEVNIRVTAVDGLADLARSDKNAEYLLTRFFTSPDLSIRRRAIRGYLRAGEAYFRDSAAAASEVQRRMGELKTKLPVADHGLISLAVTNIKTVPHPAMPDKFPAGNTRPRNPYEPPRRPTPAPQAR
jgi:hypothetical protein